MKRILAFGSVILMILGLCACQKREMADLSSAAGNEYKAIVWEDRTYVPYCAVAKKECGKQVGIVDGDKNDRVYEYDGYSTEEWIVNVYVAGLMDGAMLYKEITVSDIPEGLQSEYEWNGGAKQAEPDSLRKNSVKKLQCAPRL